MALGRLSGTSAPRRDQGPEPVMATSTRSPAATSDLLPPAGGAGEGASKWTSLLVRVRPLQRLAGEASWPWPSPGLISSTSTCRVRPSSRRLIWAAMAACRASTAWSRSALT